jgi:DNA-binding helix-hairpin-helix protein with protein kinase domain
MPPTYDQQYCEKHNQHYGDHLHRCPICWGEELGKEPIIVIDYTGTIKEGDKYMEDKGV